MRLDHGFHGILIVEIQRETLLRMLKSQLAVLQEFSPLILLVGLDYAISCYLKALSIWPAISAKCSLAAIAILK